MHTENYLHTSAHMNTSLNDGPKWADFLLIYLYIYTFLSNRTCSICSIVKLAF